jgi:hypothetical protein
MIEQGRALGGRDPQIRRAPNSAGLYDVLDLILDKGIVIDAFVRVSLVGIELLTIDARVVIASVDTYLRYAEGAERLQLYNRSESQRLPEFLGKEGKRKMATAGMNLASKGVERLAGGGHHDGDEDEEEEQHAGKGEGIAGRFAHSVRNAIGKVVDTVTGGGDEDDDEGEGEAEERRAGGGNDRGESRHRPDRERERERDRGNGHGRKLAKAGGGR